MAHPAKIAKTNANGNQNEIPWLPALPYLLPWLSSSTVLIARHLNRGSCAIIQDTPGWSFRRNLIIDPPDVEDSDEEYEDDEEEDEDAALPPLGCSTLYLMLSSHTPARITMPYLRWIPQLHHLHSVTLCGLATLPEVPLTGGAPQVRVLDLSMPERSYTNDAQGLRTLLQGFPQLTALVLNFRHIPACLAEHLPGTLRKLSLTHCSGDLEWWRLGTQCPHLHDLRGSPTSPTHPMHWPSSLLRVDGVPWGTPLPEGVQYISCHVQRDPHPWYAAHQAHTLELAGPALQQTWPLLHHAQMKALICHGSMHTPIHDLAPLQALLSTCPRLKRLSLPRCHWIPDIPLARLHTWLRHTRLTHLEGRIPLTAGALKRLKVVGELRSLALEKFHHGKPGPLEWKTVIKGGRWQLSPAGQWMACSRTCHPWCRLLFSCRGFLREYDGTPGARTHLNKQGPSFPAFMLQYTP